MKKLLIPIVIFLMVIVLGNVSYMFRNNFTFSISANAFTLEKRILVSKEILNMVGKKDYNLIGKGSGSEFASFTMNYEYLTWWLDHGPSIKNENLKIYISESTGGIKIENRNK